MISRFVFLIIAFLIAENAHSRSSVQIIDRETEEGIRGKFKKARGEYDFGTVNQCGFGTPYCPSDNEMFYFRPALGEFYGNSKHHICRNRDKTPKILLDHRHKEYFWRKFRRVVKISFGGNDTNSALLTVDSRRVLSDQGPKIAKHCDPPKSAVSRTAGTSRGQRNCYLGVPVEFHYKIEFERPERRFISLREKLGVSDLLCMSNLFHASPKKEHDENDIIKRAIGSIAEGR